MDALHLEHVEDLIDGCGRVDFIRSLQPKVQTGSQREANRKTPPTWLKLCIHRAWFILSLHVTVGVPLS